MTQPSQEELRRRLKAARALRDLSVKELAALIPPESRLGERTLRKLESGEQTLLPPTLRELAAALDLPYDWFVCPDPAELVVTPSRLGELQEQTAAFQTWAEAAVERLLDYRAEAYGRVLGRLDDFETRFTRIEETRQRVIDRLDAMHSEQTRLAELVTSRLDEIDDTLEPIVDLAVTRTGGDFAAEAASQGRAEAARAWDGKDRRQQGQASRRRSS